MPFGRIVIRTLEVLAVIFFILSAIYYHPSQSILPLIFLLQFLAADFLIPWQNPKKPAGKTSFIAEKVVLILLIASATGGFIALAYLWKLGHFHQL